MSTEFFPYFAGVTGVNGGVTQLEHRQLALAATTDCFHGAPIRDNTCVSAAAAAKCFYRTPLRVNTCDAAEKLVPAK